MIEELLRALLCGAAGETMLRLSHEYNELTRIPYSWRSGDQRVRMIAIVADYDAAYRAFIYLDR